MPTPRVCSFCRRSFPQGMGMVLVRNDGSMLWFCSSKCRRNMLNLGRNPARVRWVRKAKTSSEATPAQPLG